MTYISLIFYFYIKLVMHVIGESFTLDNDMLERYHAWGIEKCLMGADVPTSGSNWRNFSDEVKKRLSNMFKLRRGLAVDSGAADSVYPTSWIKRFRIKVSRGSLKGLFYVSASNSNIMNDGEFKSEYVQKKATGLRCCFSAPRSTNHLPVSATRPTTTSAWFSTSTREGT